MAVENPLYINEFNELWPDGLDPKSQGDDHIRNIKAAIKRTFPNITGPVTVTQAQLNSLGTAGAINVPGMVSLWAGSIGTIPAGWKLCNGTGTISTGMPVPNLMDRFIVGAGGTVAPGVTGGTGTHTHVVTVAGTALTLAQIPSHSHSSVTLSTHILDGGGVPVPFVTGISGGGPTGLAGGGQAHTHTATVDPVSHLPPFYALAYIIKD